MEQWDKLWTARTNCVRGSTAEGNFIVLFQVLVMKRTVRRCGMVNKENKLACAGHLPEEWHLHSQTYLLNSSDSDSSQIPVVKILCLFCVASEEEGREAPSIRDTMLWCRLSDIGLKEESLRERGLQELWAMDSYRVFWQEFNKLIFLLQPLRPWAE